MKLNLNQKFCSFLVLFTCLAAGPLCAKDNKTTGEKVDQAIDNTKEEAQAAKDKAKEIAENAADKAKEKAKEAKDEAKKKAQEGLNKL